MFWKKKNPSVPGPPNPTLQRLFGGIVQRQRRLANYLNGRTAHWGRKQQIVFMILLCGGLVAINLASIGLKRTRYARLHESSALIVLPSSENGSRGGGFTAQDSADFRLMRHDLDSLYSTQEGRDSILALISLRPGMIDSFLAVERMIFPSAPADTHYLNLKKQLP